MPRGSGHICTMCGRAMPRGYVKGMTHITCAKRRKREAAARQRLLDKITARSAPPSPRETTGELDV